MSHNYLKATSQFLGREYQDSDKLTHEQTAEIHACQRLHERYGVPLDMTADVMIDHLATILAGESQRRQTLLDEKHYGRELHKVWYRQQKFFVVYDPKIMRIATYLPNNAHTRRLFRQ